MPRSNGITKVCSNKSCAFNGEAQPLSSFPKSKTSRDGLTSWCKACHSEANRKWTEENRERHRFLVKRWSMANRDKESAKAKRWQLANRERHLANGREYKRKHAAEIAAIDKAKLLANPERHWTRRALTRCKVRAKENGVPFSITAEDLLPLPEFCSVFGIKLDYFSGPVRRSWASVDRIVPSLGYVPGNVRVISFAANVAKLDGDESGLVPLVRLAVAGP